MMREVLRYVGITVEQRQGLYIPQAVVNAIYAKDTTKKDTTNSYMADYRHATSTTSEVSRASDAGGAANAGGREIENTWRKVDAASRRFSDSEKYSGILAESPSLAETRKAYMTYSNQKEFSRADRVKLVSCVLKGPALNYWMSHIDERTSLLSLEQCSNSLNHSSTPLHINDRLSPSPVR
jgi:hypothetical protein